MELYGRTILFCSDFAAPYEGNFIKSIRTLSGNLCPYGIKLAFLFPAKCNEQIWWKSFSQEYDSYCIINPHDEQEVSSYIKLIGPSIIHTHFEGFDISVAKSVKELNYNTQIIWHLHDYFSFHENPLKAVYQCYCFWLHYNWYAKGISTISVCDYMLSFVSMFKKLPPHRIFHRSKIIPNGIDTTRIRQRLDYSKNKVFTFLTYGGRNADKRIDILIQAAKIVSKSIDVRVIITRGVDTDDIINGLFKGDVPKWCQIVPQQEDVCGLMEKADCFVSTSVHETFSYAVCEASIFGLPVIQSDIDGTKWNASNPSTFMFKSKNVKDLCRAMIEVIQMDEVLMKKACIETQKRNRKLYSLDKWSENIIEFYQSL